MTMHETTARWHVVGPSGLHGTGVYAARDIPEGTRIIDYGGRRITTEQADAKPPANPDEPFHTFFFALSSGKIIDGGSRGNDARWINHSCAPNCEAQENAAGTRVHIVALRNIAKGEELFYDYGLTMDGRVTKKMKQQYQCLCGAPNCRGTMLALPKQAGRKRGQR
jgi:SET domain-containing protein